MDQQEPHEIQQGHMQNTGGELDWSRLGADYVGSSSGALGGQWTRHEPPECLGRSEG